MWWIKVKRTGEILRLRSKGTNGYYSRSRAITALKSSCFLHENGMVYSELELVNRLGLTIAEMTIFPVDVGYAFRHVEGWYWINPSTQRVWFARPGDAERCWKMAESRYAVGEKRSPRVRPDKAGYDMVQGVANGGVIVLANWY